MKTNTLLNRYRLSIFLFPVILLFFVLGARISSFAQEDPHEIAKKYGITFPIEELGGCIDYSSCRTYCEDPLHHAACIDFAKKKGFHKEDPVKTHADRFIEAAKRELGCDSESACREFCSNEINWERCGEFAKRHNLSGGATHNPADAKVLEKAKEALGCTSYASCLSFCSSEANRQKCSDFANSVGLRGGEHYSGPGGCSSEATCKAFCSDPNNFQECSKFGGGEHGGIGGGFTGPGGCNSEESCRTYCQNNPKDCHMIVSGEQGGIADPAKASQEYAKFCRDNPDKCAHVGAGPFESKEAREELEKFCSANPQKCNTGQLPSATGGYPGTNLDPAGGYLDQATYCQQAGCTWTGSSCSCQGTSGTTVEPTGPTGTTNYPSPSYSTPSYEIPTNIPTPPYGTP